MTGIEGFGRDFGDAVNRADHLFTDRMIFVQQLQQAVVVGVAGAVFTHADFLSDNTLLFLNSLVGKVRCRHKVQQKTQILFKQTRAAEIITGHVRRGERVRIGSVSRQQAQRAVAVRQIEHLVLQIMRDTGRRVIRLPVKCKAAIGSAVVRSENGIKTGEALLGKNADTQAVGSRCTV